MCVCGGSIAKWLVHWPGDRKVPGLIPSYATLVLLLLFPLARNFTHIATVYPAVKWGPGGLISIGEAAHSAITSMGTWGSKFPTVLSGVGVVVEVKVLQPLSLRPAVGY